MSSKNKTLQALENASKELGYLIYARGGTVPHLTPDNFEKIYGNKHTVWNLPLSTVYEQPGEEVMKEFGKSFIEFANLENCTLLLNVNDSVYPKSDLYKYNEEKSISIWAPSGRRKISPDEYMNVLQTFGINVCIPPSDTIPGGMANKRCQKSADRTVRFLDRCLEIRNEKGLDIPIFGVLEGGDNIGYRQKCAKEIAKRDVDGYVLNGFDILGNNLNSVCLSTLEYLPEKKLMIMFGTFTPPEIIESVQLGIDLFDSVVCCEAAERGCALDFNFSLQNSKEINQNVSTPSKKQKQESDDLKRDYSNYEMDLRSNEYTDDMKPLVVGCQCYCCSRYTRAYLHHLLVTKEMLAEVLLIIHNLQHWTNFFQAIKICHENGTLDELLKFVAY